MKQTLKEMIEEEKRREQEREELKNLWELYLLVEHEMDSAGDR